ncbi:MAG TPA: hypothetical protein P5133_13915 [Spirochaetia bacterium]|nr:hypothetical protein [Spirochaetia bacterium]HRZ66023.1 hypothetical protein [Spirochaetia bacterium]
MRKAFLALIAATLLFASSCAQAGGGSGDKKATITGVGWSIQNMKYISGATCGYNFTIYYEGDIGAEDVEYAEIGVPNDSEHVWGFDLADEPGLLDAARSRISESGFVFSACNDVLPIGATKAVLVLKNGSRSEYSFTTGIPGMIGANGYQYVYTADYDPDAYPIPAGSRRAALGRATISSGTYDPTSIYLNFAINDGYAYNGYVWAYDGSDNFLGVSHRFYNTGTYAADPYLNSGGGLKKDGSTNSAVLKASDFYTGSGASMSSTVFGQISRCEVVLLDGAQYATPGDYSGYDHRSVSDTITLIAD